MARSILTRAGFTASLVVMSLVLGVGEAGAIASIRVTPQKTTVSGIRAVESTPLTLLWTVNPAPGPGRTFASSGGAFVIDVGGRQTLMSAGPLAAQTPAPGAPAVFTETLSIPSAVVAEAMARGANRILFVRSFEVTYTVVELVVNALGARQNVNRNVRTTAEAAAVIDLTSGMGGPLQVFRLLLRFDDGSPLRVLAQSSPLRVFADVSYSGGGTLEGVWEVADASSTAGEPVFVPLARVHRFLGAGQRITLEGPPMPTQHTGLHLVRFRVETPRTPEQDPVIRYRVLSPGAGGPPVRIASLWPPPGQQLSPKTRFRWQGIEEAAAYKLELFARSQAGDRWVPLFSRLGQSFRDNRGHGGTPLPYEGAHATGGLSGPDPLEGFGEPTTSLLLPGLTTETTLSALALRRVELGELYLWRVRALAEDGRTLGLSEPQLLRAPGGEVAEAPETP